jgi:ABC-type branched-subunit amino acid transport system substrate-binding protein
MRLRTALPVLLAAGGLLAACTSGSDSSSSDSTTTAATTAPAASTTVAPATSAAGTSAPETTTTVTTPARTDPVASGPAPGVTADSIKIGVTFPDLKAIADIASLDHGDQGKAFQILFDDINAKGGINGRKIVPVIVPVKPIGTEPAEAACVQLTQDEQVFLVVGFLQGDDVLCPLETHATGVIGGQMSPERLARAKAPWYTTESGTDLQSDIVTAMAKAGEFDGKLGVFGSATEKSQINDVLLPLLKEQGVEVVDTAIVEAGDTVDITANNAQVAVIAEKFKSEGIDQVLAVGASGLGWASGVENTDYRPQLLLTDPGSIQAYVTDKAGRDLSVLDKAVAGNPYGPAENIWKLPAMQDCIKKVEAGGVPVPEPSSIPAGSGAVYIAGTTACTYVTLLTALIEAAGKDLNYGTLVAGSKGLEVALPNVPEPVTYGPPPSADGDQAAYLFDWDLATKTFVLRQS